MKKHELLVPAGNMECLLAAIHNGCDAVYLGCKNFGARRFANNFTNDEIKEAIKLCHLYGVKIYVTMNTLVKNNEVDDFLNQAHFLHKNGVDALIVQDFGMICYLREKFPNLEIHASTQANISSIDVCKLYYNLGVKRVVFSRELSIDEIDSIDIPIEKEAFIHGALCISYSGCCLMSSMLGGRSGNRGECAGSCRLPYSLVKNGKVLEKEKYLLSTKELNTSSKIKRLLDSSIYSFKIEGRMKSPLYVGFITRFYRKLIDGEKLDIKQWDNELKTIFNREFTFGRMFNEKDELLMNTISPNHKGLNIGEVLEVSKEKIKIKLYDGIVLNQQDAIRFVDSNKGFVVNYLYDKNGKLINSTTGICYVLNKINLNKKDIVSKTQDYKLQQNYLKMNTPKKIQITINVRAFVNKNLFVEFSDGINCVSAEGKIVEEAINAKVVETDIKRQICKLGNSPFSCNNIEINLDDNIFIPMRDLNEIRRYLVDKLIDIRKNSKAIVIEKDVLFEKDNNINNNYSKTFVVRNRKQLDKCLSYNDSIVYIDSKELYDEYKIKYDNVYYFINREIFNIKNNLEEKSLVSDYALYNDYNVIGNYTLNVTNIYTAYYLRKIGLKRICLSVELSEEELLDFIRLYDEKFGNNNFDVMIYGRVENMIIKGNVLNILKDLDDYLLIDLKQRKFPVYYDGVNTHILNYECRKLNVNKFTKICNLRYDFYDENINDIEKIVNNN